MSFQITTAFVQQYRANVMHLVQQQGSRLRECTRIETVTGKSGFFEQIGQVQARKRTSRHSDTPQMDTPHARRRVTMIDFDWADLIDKEDEVRLLISPASPYAQAAAWAFGRALDDEIIVAAEATAFTGEDGTTSTVFDTAMDVPIGTGTGEAFTVTKMRAAKRKLDEREVPDGDRYIALSAAAMEQLLGTTAVTSADFATIKALVAGDLDTFLGFKIKRLERLRAAAADDHIALFWHRDGLLVGMGKEPSARVSERSDKNYATQVFYSQTLGVTRMEEARVGRIHFDPTVAVPQGTNQ